MNIHIFNHMVKQNTQRTTADLDSIFHALSDRTRRGMLGQLLNDERTVSDLAAPYAMSLAAASKHIKKLEKAGLVTRKVLGRTHICRLNATAMKEAQAWISRYEQFWTARLDALTNELEKDLARDKANEDRD